MSVGRIVGTTAAVVTVAACAGVVVAMARADTTRKPLAERSASAALDSRPIPAQLPGSHPSTHAALRTHRRPLMHASASTTRPAASTSAVRTRAAAPTPTLTPTPTFTPTPTHTVVHTTAAPTTHAAPTTSAPKPTPSPTHATAAPRAAAHTSAPRRGVALSVRGYTGNATRVLTVKARTTSSTVATLQAWRKAPGGGWLRVWTATTAHVGSDGLSRTPSEYRSATPIGSFTLTRAFGYYSNPGTRLKYFKTTPADWWISQSGSLYNSHQRCSSRCGFNQGDPNEHLMYETPYYNYAVVIDYNTSNAPGGVRQGAGSAFFLHVSVGQPTAGCVSIAQSRLVTIMRWLLPDRHPRILIGTS